MQLEGSNVFRGYPLERFLGEVGEASHMVGVGIDGGLGQVANLQVFGQSLRDGTRTFSEGSHLGFISKEETERGTSTMHQETKSASSFYQNVRYNRPVKRHHQTPASANKRMTERPQAQPDRQPLKDPRAEHDFGGSYHTGDDVVRVEKEFSQACPESWQGSQPPSRRKRATAPKTAQQ